MDLNYYDVAISYATPDVKIADEIYAALNARNYSVFYDRGGESDIQAEIWGKNLDDYLNLIFKEKARFCIVLVSFDYTIRAWTKVEKDAARYRQIQEQREYILPITLDDEQLPNMEMVSHLRYIDINAEDVAEIFSKKYSKFNLEGDIESSLSKLTPEEPQQSQHQYEEWQRTSQSAFYSSLNDGECAWILPFHLGKEISLFDLKYHEKTEKLNYEAYSKRKIKDSIRTWRKSNQDRYKTLEGESWGKQVRLSKVEYNDESYSYTFHLEPIKYLHYISTHAKLWSSNFRALREYVFKNSLNAISRQEELFLPSHFCIHMAILSKNNEALLRQRRLHAELYPGAWEVGIGEFMHGIDKKNFSSFLDGKPDLFTFLKNSVAEEIDYYDAAYDDFSIYGFAVEYRTLAPKLLVVYQSDISIDQIIEGAKRASDSCHDASYVKAVPLEIVSVMKNNRYQQWGPTSKLVLWLSMLKTVNSESERSELNNSLNRELDKV